MEAPSVPRPLAMTEEADDEDSFFELELVVPDSDTNKCSTSTRDSLDSAETTRELELAPAIPHGRRNCPTFQHRATSASPVDKLFSKRKVLPIEGLNRPQSPISLLKSAPKFRVFTFAQSKSTVAAEKAEAGEIQGKSRGNGLLSSKFNKAENQPFFKRSGSSRKAESPENIEGSKRFSREVIQKYLRLLNPLYVKVSKKQGGSEEVAGEFPVAPVLASLPKTMGSGKPPTGPRSKQLGKSRSASVATTRVDSPARMDDSLVQLQDGIQSAILHCKRSLSVSRDFSPLSRCHAGSAEDEKTMVDLRRFSRD